MYRIFPAIAAVLVLTVSACGTAADPQPSAAEPPLPPQPPLPPLPDWSCALKSRAA